jgi:hypothetical protein
VSSAFVCTDQLMQDRESVRKGERDSIDAYLPLRGKWLTYATWGASVALVLLSSLLAPKELTCEAAAGSVAVLGAASLARWIARSAVEEACHYRSGWRRNLHLITVVGLLIPVCILVGGIIFVAAHSLMMIVTAAFSDGYR